MKFFHSHIILPENCKSRLKCLKACPTQALRIRNGSITFYDYLCVDCGACINVCPEDVYVPVVDEINDFDKFEFKIAIPSLILYTQFGSNIHPKLVHQALKNIGFDAVEDIALDIEELGFIISEYIKNKSDNKPMISSFCPAVIRLIQVSYPNMIDLISPFDVPRELTAKRIKKKYARELGIHEKKIGAIYITPCPAKAVSIKQPAEKEKSWLDGVIAINDIYKIIFPEIIHINETQKTDILDDCFYYGKGSGVIRHLLQNIDSERCLSVVGIDHIKMVLDDIEDSKLKNIDYLEAFTCSRKCVGGAFCVENPYISRHNSFMLEKNYSVPPPFDKDKVLEKFNDGFYFMENQVLPRDTRSSSSDISTSIKRMNQKNRILAKLPKKDCGLCGAPSCQTFAEDCAWGEADLSDCIFFTTGSQH